MGETGAITVKVPQRLLAEIKRTKAEINWPEEIRNFIRARVKKRRTQEALEKNRKVLQQLPILPRGTAAAIVRADRDSH